jgi:chromosome partitioning protein
MSSVAVWSRKGGVGKTTVALHLAWYFARMRQQRVLAIDLDIQGNFSAALGEAQLRCRSSQLFERDFDILPLDTALAPGTGTIHLVGADPAIRSIESLRPSDAVGNFRAAWKKLRSDYDIVILDCPPSEHVAVLAALMTVRFALAPIDVGRWSVDGIAPMLRTYLGIQRSFNPELRFLGMLACRVDNRVAMAKEVLAQLAGAYGQFLIPLKLSQRHAFAAVAVRGEPVWTDRGAAEAASEMLAVCRYVNSTVFADAPARELNSAL